ncbi:MAG TPA: TfoX/Sxy family protein [Burkholderiales bacterium]|jgi:TfoX/Sxy family transcriptional regulator of competence genes
MATDPDFIDYVCEQIRHAGHVTSRRMFGEYAVYVDGRVIGFACDNQLFIKPLPQAREFIGSPKEKPPYPGAKMYFLIDEQLEDSAWMTQLARLTAAAAPPPKEKKAPAQKAAKAAKGAVKKATPAKATKAGAKKAAVKKTAPKKAPLKKVAAKKAAARKAAVRKAPAKKAAKKTRAK